MAFCWRSLKRFRICAWTETSSDETASSATISEGSTASARAMPTRWRCPPLSSYGSLRLSPGLRPTSSEQLVHACCPRATDREVVDDERLADDVAHLHPRRQRRIGVLEDDLRPAPQRPCLAGIEQRRPSKRISPPVGILEVEDGACQRRLAAAALADEAQRLADADRQVHAVNGLDDRAAAHRRGHHRPCRSTW